MWEDYEYMDFDDEQYFADSSKILEAISEAKDKIRGFFSEEVKSVIDEAKNAKAETEQLRRERAGLQNDIAQLNQQKQELQKRLENDEGALPRKYIDRFVKKYTGFYAPGDKVFVVTTKNKRPVCPRCNGDKKLLAVISPGEQTNVQCPTCNGCGRLDKYESYVVKKTVAEVRLTLCFESGNRVGVWSSECVYLEGNDYNTKPENIFPTEAEAQAEADRRNQERDEKDGEAQSGRAT